MENLANQITELSEEDKATLNDLLAKEGLKVATLCGTGQHWDNVLKRCVADDGP